jgi:hypothetical protein
MWSIECVEVLSSIDTSPPPVASKAKLIASMSFPSTISWYSSSDSFLLSANRSYSVRSSAPKFVTTTIGRSAPPPVESPFLFFLFFFFFFPPIDDVLTLISSGINLEMIVTMKGLASHISTISKSIRGEEQRGGTQDVGKATREHQI